MTTSLVDRTDHIENSPALRERRPLRRVLHVINGEHYAGAERVQDLLAAVLPEFGYQPIFAAVKPDQFPLRRRNADAPLFEARMRHKFDLRPARAVAHLARREGCELIHTHTVRSAMIGRIAARMSGLPMIHHLHSPTAGDTTHKLRNAVNAFIERRSIAGIAAAIAVSKSLACYGERHGIPADRIHVVHNGVPVLPSLAIRETPVGTWTLGCTALFRPRKGLEVLLEALAELRRDGIDARLRAVGRFETADYEHTIHDLSAKLGVQSAVEWRGFRTDVAAELAKMDLFVLPSLFGEGLPMVVLEAMAHGVPVVGTRVEGVPEAIRENVDGLIAEPGDAGSLAEQIRRVIASEVDWDSLRETAHRRQVNFFSDRSMAAATAAVYRRVLDGTVVESPAAADAAVAPATS
ncbi:MAG: glycosyltransferase [Planctomycetaceae bacterium]|nr:glycosyltransferase [Planctomycetaceae bacterium]